MTGYPWATGDALLAADLNAAIANSAAYGPFLPISGGTVTPGPLTVGNGTGAPTLTLNGAAGTAKAVQWQTNATNRWLLQTDTSDNLALHAYDASGVWKGMAVQFANDSSSIVTNYPLITNATNATVAQGITGIFATATNTGIHAAQGAKFYYVSNSSAGDGFDTGLTNFALFNPVLTAGPPPFYEAFWGVAVSPNDQTHNWNCIIGEFNVVNRGPDAGWKRDRTTANPTGGFLLVPEVGNFGLAGGGDGTHATFAYGVGHSGGNNGTTGVPAKWYNGLLIEPNAMVGQTGRGIYATGDITGTASQYPYGPMQTDGTWLHGIDHTLATYTDGNASTMLVGQGMRWINGTTGTPTGAATMAASGTGANVSLVLTAGGTGGVQIGPRVGFGVAPIAKPTVSGAKGSNAALASLMTALVAFGLVTDSTTA